ncbi:LacI family DNA-binding transcriptional regulator [Geminisphaera colitermitum]|uniref:LacI family DNA-binding transcriptional regulator n=1 Tax=Geminisphaera colitermitum TaxID=1148786 RepID=UPI0018E3D7E6|nr:LacI family DNA-binding transcriptional regulator [Geminisphaera colitermitum]
MSSPEIDTAAVHGVGDGTSVTGKVETIDLQELSRRLGLSVGTVSRAFNNRRGVSESTRRKVLEAAREHNYAPNSAARLLMARPALHVGLFFAPYYSPARDINPAAIGLIDALRNNLQVEGADMSLLHYKDDAELERQAQDVDVGLFYGHFEQHSFDVLHRLGIPALLYDKQSPHPDQICVVANTRHACNTAVQYLAALGHERIAMVTGPGDEYYFLGYIEAFPAALREFGLQSHPGWAIELPADLCNKDGACAALLSLLQQASENSNNNRPTAIICASDWLALGARRAAREFGLKVPDDISLIGYDNLALTAELDPPLTTFDIHISRVVQTLTHLALRLGKHRHTSGVVRLPREILLLPDLVKRESCRCLRARAAAG